MPYLAEVFSMVFKVFENGKLIGTINKAFIDTRQKPNIKITGTWEGIFPFTNIADQKTPFELRGEDSFHKEDVYVTGAVLIGKKYSGQRSLDVFVLLAVNLATNPSESLEKYIYFLHEPSRTQPINDKPACRVSAIIGKKEYYKYDEKLFTQKIIDKAFEALEKHGLGDEMNNLEYELQGANLFKTLKILHEYFLIF